MRLLRCFFSLRIRYRTFGKGSVSGDMKYSEPVKRRSVVLRGASDLRETRELENSLTQMNLSQILSNTKGR